MKSTHGQLHSHAQSLEYSRVNVCMLSAKVPRLSSLEGIHGPEKILYFIS